MDWNAKIDIVDNTIQVWAEGEEKKADRYCYYLYNVARDVIEKSQWVKESNYFFKVDREGAYFVKMFRAENETQTSKLTSYVDYYDKQTKLEFDEFCQKDFKYNFINKLDCNFFYKMKYPYKDFAVIVSRSNEKVSSRFLNLYNLEEEKIAMAEKSVYLLSENVNAFKTYGTLLSGLLKYEKKLINGENDLKNEVEVSQDLIGSFTYLKRKDELLEVGNDYFGTSKLYYYMKNEISVISNNYHLMLLILRELGVRMEANAKLILALLCKSGQAFQQSISRERELCDAYMLPVDKFFEIDENGVQMKDKNIASVYQMEKNSTDLQELLKKGKEEIIENAEIILADKRYDKIVLDLTGGLDSRLVYGAISNLEQYRNKIGIHADGLDEQINQAESDLAIAVKLNCLNQYDYNIVSEKRFWRDIEVVECEMISQSILSGYYYPYPSWRIATVRKDMIPAFELNGFYGEICCRPYYTRKLLQQKTKYKDKDVLLSTIINKKKILSGKAYNALRSALEEELQLLPGNSWLEKWENHYLFYRNGLHCNTIWEYEKGTPQWGPLQSKALYKYKHLTYGESYGVTEQLQMIQEMNPKLNLFPFEDAQDEIERKQFINTQDDDFFEICIKERYEEEKKKWMDRRAERRSNSFLSMVESGEDFNEIRGKKELYDKTIEARISEILHKLMGYENGVFKDVFGLSVFKIMREETLTLSEKKTLYQKLVSVYMQVQIFESMS